MKKNSVRYLEGLVERGVRMNLSALKHFRYRERGIDSIVKKVIPVDIDNAIASNLSYYLRKYANSYFGQIL